MLWRACSYGTGLSALAPWPPAGRAAALGAASSAATAAACAQPGFRILLLHKLAYIAWFGIWPCILIALRGQMSALHGRGRAAARMRPAWSTLPGRAAAMHLCLAASATMLCMLSTLLAWQGQRMDSSCSVRYGGCRCMWPMHPHARPAGSARTAHPDHRPPDGTQPLAMLPSLLSFTSSTLCSALLLCSVALQLWQLALMGGARLRTMLLDRHGHGRSHARGMPAAAHLPPAPADQVRGWLVNGATNDHALLMQMTHASRHDDHVQAVFNRSPTLQASILRAEYQ